MTAIALQDLMSPHGVCFGCGGANPNGLHIKSYWDQDQVHVITRHLPEEKYCGWPDLVYGGLLAMLADCHSTGAATTYHTRGAQARGGEPRKVNGVTGSLGIKYDKATTMGVALTLRDRGDGPL